MPVRDTTAWRHAIINRKVINMDHDGTKHVMCAWDTCEKDGIENIHVRVKTHADGAEERFMHYVFCSEGHKDYWLENIRPGSGNNHSPGMRISVL